LLAMQPVVLPHPTTPADKRRGPPAREAGIEVKPVIRGRLHEPRS